MLCRVKPVLKEDQHEEGRSVVVTTDPNNESCLSVLSKGKSRIFEMDKVFHPQAAQEEVLPGFRKLWVWWGRGGLKQEEGGRKKLDSVPYQVFQEIEPLVTSCIDGYHVCIFAYGQTGSGKTYTMEVRPRLEGFRRSCRAEWETHAVVL